MKNTEFFPLVDEDGNITGRASREYCHSGSFALHPVVHLHVFNSKGELYLQKRALHKDTQPGKWDTAVGGHVDDGETIEKALFRETMEELGIADFEPVFIQKYKFVSTVESELVHCFKTIFNETIFPNPDEISEGKFWKINEIVEAIGSGVFTPNFENEFQNFLNI